MHVYIEKLRSTNKSPFYSISYSVFFSFFSQTLDEIARQENNILELKKAIRDKEAPIKVAQTRINDRSFRPEIELCRDPAHTQ